MAEIYIRDGEPIEGALRRFKRKVLEEEILREAKRHTFYLKPGERKRIKSKLARKRKRKKRSPDGSTNNEQRQEFSADRSRSLS